MEGTDTKWDMKYSCLADGASKEKSCTDHVTSRLKRIDPMDKYSNKDF